MKVKDAMTKAPATIDPEAPVGTAIDVMRTRQVRHLPVVDDAGHLLGIATDRDLRHAALGPALSEYLSAGARRRLRGLCETLDDLKIRDVMTWGVVTIEPDAPLPQAALLMVEGRVGSLPVVDNGRRPCSTWKDSSGSRVQPARIREDEHARLADALPLRPGPQRDAGPEERAVDADADERDDLGVVS